LLLDRSVALAKWSAFALAVTKRSSNILTRSRTGFARRNCWWSFVH
jgi:hypothetical protein